MFDCCREMLNELAETMGRLGDAGDDDDIVRCFEDYVAQAERQLTFWQQRGGDLVAKTTTRRGR